MMRIRTRSSPSCCLFPSSRTSLSLRKIVVVTILCTLVFVPVQQSKYFCVHALAGLKLPKFDFAGINFPKFGTNNVKNADDKNAVSGGFNLLQQQANVLERKKKDLLDAISFTSNGKTATPEQQMRVLEIVGQIETEYPPSPNLLSDPKEAQILDGVWYLQYTSPSEIVVLEEDGITSNSNADSSANTDTAIRKWKPINAEEGDSKIPTSSKFQAQGTVSASGIVVDTSNKLVTQTIDIATSRVTNNVTLDWGHAIAGGAYRPSASVPNRALVAFDTAQINFDAIQGLGINLGFLFPIIRYISGSKENGWLETTFVDDNVRIGRGNKGTMFVLTRDRDAVQP